MSLPLRRSALHRLPLISAMALTLFSATAAIANPLVQGRSNDHSRVVLPKAGRAAPYLIQLVEPSLLGAAREGLVAKRDGQHLDVSDAQSVAYVAQLRDVQNALLQDLSSSLGRTLAPIDARYQFQHAFNGIAVRLTPAEAAIIARRAEVRSLQPMRTVPVSTDRGPQLIGAQSFWSGQQDGVTDRVFQSGFDPASSLANKGEGVVVGIVDTGLNFANPSFAATDSAGYQHINPLGSGQYLGLCGTGGTPEWTPQCNDKVIGAYDFASALMPDIWENDPAAVNGPGPEDENGHGSHTASTSAGNAVVAQVPGGPTANISGVAPHANLVVYDACYTTGDGRGSCTYIALVASINQAVADGVVDVLNYSIAGGSDPWNEDPSKAFLDAFDAGIFIAAAGGNSGPSASSIDHVEPWVSTVAASTHSRGPFVNMLNITGPAPVPPALTNIKITVPSSSVPLTAPIAGSLVYNAADPLHCTAAAPGSYTGKIVMVYRGTCTFVAKILAVEAGGASGVVLVNNAEAALNPSLDGTHIPVATLLKSQGDAIAAFHATAPSTTTARIEYPSQPTVAIADQIARFSGRGPTSFALLKPDVAAPGSDILAALNGEANSWGVLSGTSMASPHIAGAAALLRKARPEWTSAEIKSALMLTAKTNDVTDIVNGTPATAFAMGAGRAQADHAYRSGLVMDESSYHFLRADPSRNGKPETLNLASLGGDACIGSCSFVRTFRNPGSSTQSWNITLNGVSGGVTPDTLTLAPGASGSVKFDINVAGVAQGSYAMGSVTLTPTGGSSEALHMPAAVYVDPFRLELAPQSLSIDASVGESTTSTFNVRNLGNAGLNWNLLSGTQTVPVVNQPSNTLNGMVSSLYTDGNIGAYVGDDIVLDQPTTFRKLAVPGFLFANYLDTVDMYASMITWSIYADAGGKPSGYPGGGAAPIWSLSLAPDAVGVTPASNSLDVDLDAAGAALSLPAGKYWLVAYPEFSGHVVNGVGVMWFRFLMNTQVNGMGQTLNNDPEFGGTAGADWENLSNGWDGHFGAAMIGSADRQCTPAWATPSVSSGTLGAGSTETVTLTINTSGLAAGSHVGQLCVGSNDPAKPLTLIPVTLNLSP